MCVLINTAGIIEIFYILTTPPITSLQPLDISRASVWYYTVLHGCHILPNRRQIIQIQFKGTSHIFGTQPKIKPHLDTQKSAGFYGQPIQRLRRTAC
jgi:hypothetical protein